MPTGNLAHWVVEPHTVARKGSEENGTEIRHVWDKTEGLTRVFSLESDAFFDVSVTGTDL